MEKPDVDYIDGLSPAISIDQKGVSKNPRSTVATVTEIYDYLRLLFARVGVPYCPHCGQVIRRQTIQQIVDAILAEAPGTRAMLLAPVVRHRRGQHEQVFDAIRRAGFVRVRVDGVVRDIEEQFDLDRYQWHDIDVVVDRLVTPAADAEDAEATRQRIADSVEQALKLGEGILQFAPEGRPEETFSEHFACPNTTHPPYSVGEIEPRNFSFNSPHGACAACTGLGMRMELDPELVVPNPKLTINEGAILPYQRLSTTLSWYRRRLEALGRAYGFDLDTPLGQLDDRQWSALMEGAGSEQIQVSYRTRRGRDRDYAISLGGRAAQPRAALPRDGVRLGAQRPRALHGRGALPGLPRRAAEAGDARRLRRRPLDRRGRSRVRRGRARLDRAAARGGLAAVGARAPDCAPDPAGDREPLTFLRDVGLQYLTLDRASGTLSGGEGQRIRLATQIGSALMGVLYVCDEPSIGLHAVDNQRLIGTLTRLRDLGNTVLVVEHDEAMMLAADHLIDLGPGAGEHGGEVVAQGTPQQVMRSRKSITAQYLSASARSRCRRRAARAAARR